jgi:hypothetical protein
VQEATGTIYIGESGLGGRGSEYSMCWSAYRMLQALSIYVGESGLIGREGEATVF